jgi:glycosyltransferase involved in cell wall biosynthesis
MACGTPVIAYGRGGATETVLDGSTGTFFAEPTADSLAQAITRWESRPAHPTAAACRERAEVFSRAAFEEKLCRSVLEKDHAKMGAIRSDRDLLTPPLV